MERRLALEVDGPLVLLGQPPKDVEVRRAPFLRSFVPEANRIATGRKESPRRSITRESTT